MPVIIKGETYYRTREACRKAGISKATLFRRFSNGILQDSIFKDSNGWRLFSEDDIRRLTLEHADSGKDDVLAKDLI